jgi:hypothetical protein
MDAAMREVDMNLHPERAPAPWQAPSAVAPPTTPSLPAPPISATSEPVSVAPSTPPAAMPDDPTLN